MKKNNFKHSIWCIFSIFILLSCTNLDETVYSSIVSSNYIQTKADIVSLSIRPFNHAYWSLTVMPEIQENSADQWMTPTRLNAWYNAGKHHRVHQHTWTIDEDFVNQNWEAPWQGISQINNVLDILETIDPDSYGMPQDKFDRLYWGNRTLRQWFYMRLFDLYRNIPIYRSFTNGSLNSETQVLPQETFNFIEEELLLCLEHLPAKKVLGGNKENQNMWNKAGAAALLMRLYLNSEKWTGVANYFKCALIAEKIINGEYGPYKLENTWDKVFAWDNHTSDEIVFGFSSNINYQNSHYAGAIYWGMIPPEKVVSNYFRFTLKPNNNPRYALTPGLDNDYNELPYKLGKPVRKFMKYSSDYRLKFYRNSASPGTPKINPGEREGMFMFGYIPDLVVGGYIKSRNQIVYLRDQMGHFNGARPDEEIPDKRSSVDYGDNDSGWRMIKYPIYPDSDPQEMHWNADYAEIRLAEVYYSLAECKLRDGKTLEAGDLLNAVRKRNYPSGDYGSVLYKGTKAPQGNVTLDMEEMLDEWGREFLGELRRRTDLCRFNRFTEVWWDKTNTDPTRDIMPLSRKALNANSKLVQNQGYESN